MAADRFRMGELHEKFLAELNGGRKSKGSGSQWTDKGDGRNNHLDTPFAFAWDGKSSCGEGINVTRSMLAKIVEESGGERPQLGLRFYATERLDEVAADWIAVRADDFAELLEAARAWERHQEQISALEKSLREELDRTPEPAPLSGRGTGFREAMFQTSAEMSAAQAALVPHMPPREMWPCVLVEIWHDASRARHHRAFRIASDGLMQPFQASEIRIEPSGVSTRRLMIDGVIVRRGDVRIDGALHLRAGMPEQPVAEQWPQMVRDTTQD